VQPFVPTYRRPLFDAIGMRLAAENLRLEVWHDFPKGRVAARGNAASGEWSSPIRQHRLSIGRRNVTYRNVRERSRGAVAVVAGLASTNLETYGLAFDPRVNLMLWGHGKNFTARNNPVDAKLERWLTKRSSHLFTYTDEGKQHLVEHGVPHSRVTVVYNSTDTESLRHARSAVTEAEISAIRQRYQLGQARVALFVGAFDGPKRLPFLIEALDEVHRTHPELITLLAGAGPDEETLREAASTRPYVQVIGRLDAAGLAGMSHVAELIVMPGRVGLVAVDALALGLPIVTTEYPFHAPEASYLTSGHDSLWTKFEVGAYADGISNLLENDAELHRLARNARATGVGFSVDQSAQHFVSGIMSGLGR